MYPVIFCCFEVGRVVCSDGILQTFAGIVGQMSYCCLSIISNLSLKSPLFSDMNKIFYLDIFSFWTILSKLWTCLSVKPAVG